MAEKSGAGVLLLGLGDKAKAEKPKSKEKSASKSSSLSAAKALLSAFEANDPEAVDEALKLHYEMCREAEYEE